MREIKFRGKSTGDLAPWIYGYYHFDKSLNQHFICDADTLKRYEALPETMGEYTGLKDKNGVEIYEGDVVKISEGHPHWIVKDWTIIFHLSAFCLHHPEIVEQSADPCSLILFADLCEENGLSRDISQYIEVTGNIHQSPTT